MARQLPSRGCISSTSLVVLLVVIAFASAALGVPRDDDDVIQLTDTNFRQLVLNSNEIWLVEFFAPWCGHCQKLAPEWKRAAAVLKGVVKLGAVNGDDYPSLVKQYSVSGFPTIKVFSADKNHPLIYNEGRTAKAIVDFALRTVESTVQERMSSGAGRGKAGGGKQSSSSSSSSSSFYQNSEVVELTADEFERRVLESGDSWMIEFYAPWCGHCKSLVPAWKAAAEALSGKIRFGAIDATVHSTLAERYGVRGYPSLKFFAAGSGKPEDYTGGRSDVDLIEFGERKFSAARKTPVVRQIVSHHTLENNCLNEQLCLITFVPHIYDSGAAGRNAILELLGKMAEKFRMEPLAYTWSEGGIQEQLESKLSVGGYGYPAIVAWNAQKNRFTSMRGAVDEKHLIDFINSILTGRGPTLEIRSVPEILTIEEWDGKDSSPPTDDDYDEVPLHDTDDEPTVESSADEL